MAAPSLDDMIVLGSQKMYIEVTIFDQGNKGRTFAIGFGTMPDL